MKVIKREKKMGCFVQIKWVPMRRCDFLWFILNFCEFRICFSFRFSEKCGKQLRAGTIGWKLLSFAKKLTSKYLKFTSFFPPFRLNNDWTIELKGAKVVAVNVISTIRVGSNRIWFFWFVTSFVDVSVVAWKLKHLNRSDKLHVLNDLTGSEGVKGRNGWKIMKIRGLHEINTRIYCFAFCRLSPEIFTWGKTRFFCDEKYLQVKITERGVNKADWMGNINKSFERFSGQPKLIASRKGRTSRIKVYFEKHFTRERKMCENIGG